MTSVSKLDHGHTLPVDEQRSSTLPPSLKVQRSNAFSPNSVSSSASSSMAELFASPEVSNKDGGDSTSAAYPTASRHEPECPGNDCSCGSLASVFPSPIIEEGPCLSVSTNEGDVDHISEDLYLDAKSPLDETCFSDACCRQDSSSDDMSMSRLDELLQAGAPQEFAAESDLVCVDDLFPSLNNTGQDFPMQDAMSSWSMESFQSLVALPFPEEEFVQVESAIHGEEESASQMFAQWLRNNAHWISMSDLRKIKLKTTTIENAIRRLGGGKKGSMLFLKFVLLWVQNSQMKRAKVAEAMSANGALSSAMPPRSSPTSAGFPGMLTMPSECFPLRASSSALESSCAIQAPGVHGHAISGCGSPSPHVPAVSSPGPDWTARAQWSHTPGAEQNGAVSTSNRFMPSANCRSGSPLPRPRFGHPNSTWHLHGNIPRGVAAPTSVQPPLRSPTSWGSSCIGSGGIGDPASVTMMLQQQDCSDVNPAATTRAARKSRMERQRWSVRRNRKWSTAAHQRQQCLASAALNGGVHTTVPPWSQVVGNAPLPNFPFTSSRSNFQPVPNSRSTAMESQKNKKSERSLRLLFHKQLKQSDVGNLGRIVLPKAAETCLPPLDLRDGVSLVVEDMNSAKVWNMRYRFWPNNKSRMYLLENTGDFVKSYNLKEGDYMMMFRDNVTGKFMIKGAKGLGQAAAEMTGTARIEDVTDGGMVWNAAKNRRSMPNEEADLVLMGSTNSEESCDDSLLAELIEQSLVEDIKESSEPEMCDPLEPMRDCRALS